LKKFLDINISLIPSDHFFKFKEFVSNSYFNKSNRLINLCKFISVNYDDVKNNIITRENLSHIIYPDEPYKDASIKKLISDFNKLIDKFVCFDFLEMNEIDRDLILLRAYRKNNYKDKFHKLYQDIKNKININNYETDEYFNKLLELENELFELNFYNPYKENFQNCINKSNILDINFIANKIYIYQTLTAISSMDSSLKFDYPFMKIINEYIAKHKQEIILNYKEIYRNYLQLCLQLNPDDIDKFNELKEFIYEKYSGRFLIKPIIDLTNLISYIDHYSKKVNISHSEEVVNAYSKILDNYLYKYIEVIHQYDFKRVIDSAISINNIKFAKDFFEAFKDKISKNFREDMKNYAQGYLLYKEKKYEKALYYLLLVSNQEYHHYLTTNKLILKIYYDLKYTDKAYNLIDSYKKYFKNHIEISPAFKKRNEEFIYLYEKLLKLSEVRDKKVLIFDIAEMREIYKKVKDKPTDYKWIEGKICDLEKQVSF